LTEKSGFEKEERPRKGKPSLKKFEPNTEHRVGPERAPRYDQDALKAKASARVKEKIDQEPNSPDEEIRLNKYISNSGLCSRREADELIESGMIKVNGEVVTEMGYKVKDSDTVKYGKDVLNRERMMYVLLNKPKDFLTTMDDPQERKTVMDLVGGACKERIYPVGRLDRNTTGLLLLTNDGELTVKLTHPSNDIKKIYQAELDKPITDEHFEMIKNGIELEDGEIKPDQVAIVSPDSHVVGIEIHSGKNRIVRRIFEHLGYEVTKLDRTTYAGLTKKDLPRGKWRFLSEKELIRLKYML
jgi:23S rRNA pseudouridine2605 synthase